MKPDSLIGWTIKTMNFWLGCTKCAAECIHCYISFPSMGFGKRDPWKDIYLTQTWRDPYNWEAQLKDTNHALRVFTCSLSDFFHAKVDNRKFNEGKGWLPVHRIAGAEKELGLHRYWRDAAWQVIKDTPHCIYQILTKRPERIIRHLPADWGAGYPNVWLGTSVGCNRTLSKIDSLRKVPAAVRFVSAEPLLEDISQKINLDGIGWLIVGGESNYAGDEYLYDPSANLKKDLQRSKTPGRRTMKIEWARNLQRLAYQQDVRFYFKQMTAPRSGFNTDALGKEDTHEYPDPPQGLVWMPETKPELVVLGQ